MNDTLVVSVTIDHLRRGVQKTPAMCAFALALHDYLKALGSGPWETVNVSECGVHLCWDHQALSSDWKHSPESLAFVQLFDKDRLEAAVFVGRDANMRIFRSGSKDAEAANVGVIL
jgi:hypothetical protein